MNNKLWIWTWKGGGWGSAEADTPAEALVIAKTMGFTPDPQTCRLTTQEELDELDREYKLCLLPG